VLRSTGTADQQEASRFLAEFIGTEAAERDIYGTGPSRPDKRSIASCLSAYLLDKQEMGKVMSVITYSVDALLTYWAANTVADVTPQTCRAYMKFRKRAVGTVRRELANLRAAINNDYAEGRLTSVVPVWVPPMPKSKDRWLTRREFAALLRASRKDPRGRGHLPLFMLLAIYTAARKEAILTLRWPQVDLKRGLIDFNPPGREATNKGRPIVPIHPRLMTFLRYARRYGTDLGYVINHDQTPISDIRHGFASAASNAGLGTWRDRPYKRKGPETDEARKYVERVPVTDVTPHVLRHTSASWMVQAGVPFPVVARFLGHRSSQITEQVYAHHAPEYLADAVDALSGPRGGHQGRKKWVT
jgi:integrase